MKSWIVQTIAFQLLLSAVAFAAPALDERLAGEDEWGYRPAVGSVSEVTPPGFSWRPQAEIVSWELECGRGGDFSETVYRATGLKMNVHCPPKTLPPGTCCWRYRGVDKDGGKTNWSQTRSFEISPAAVSMPMPLLHPVISTTPMSLLPLCPRFRQ